MSAFLKACLIGSLLFLLAFFLFCPRFYLWDVVGNPLLPESYRAFYVLVQLQNSPFVKIPDIGSNVLEWRLLFPVIGFLLHIPWTIFFALPHLSALALIIYSTHLVFTRTQSWLAASIAGALTATSSAFFISTGFLGYFDAAMTLMLMVSCFSRNRIALWGAAALAPWIDERYIYALPIIFFCQWMHSPPRGRHTPDPSLRATWQMFWPVLLGLAPYLFLRAMAVFLNTDHSQSFFHDLFTRNDMTPHKAIIGTWDALRWGWVAVVLAVFTAPRWPRVFALVFISASILFLLYSAGDYSRSLMIALPMAVLGVMRLWPKRDAKTTALLISLAVLNLGMPAFHSFRAFHFQIYPLPIQLKIQKEVTRP